jgi:hypothetical protein
LPEHGVHIRGIEPAVLEQLKQYCVRFYGTYHGRQGEIITRALEEYLSSRQHQTTYSPRTTLQLRADVKAKVERIREDLILYMTDTGNETGQIPFVDVLSIIRRVVHDQRSVKRYVNEILPSHRLVERLNGRVVQVNLGWLTPSVVVPK